MLSPAIKLIYFVEVDNEQDVELKEETVWGTTLLMAAYSHPHAVMVKEISLSAHSVIKRLIDESTPKSS